MCPQHRLYRPLQNPLQISGDEEAGEKAYGWWNTFVMQVPSDQGTVWWGRNPKRESFVEEGNLKKSKPQTSGWAMPVNELTAEVI